MNPSSLPGVVLIAELFGGDGPYVAAAEAFLACRCVTCGRGVERIAVQRGDTYYCPTCWAGEAGAAAGGR